MSIASFSLSYSPIILYSSSHTYFQDKVNVFRVTDNVMVFCVDGVFSRSLFRWSCLFEEIACFGENDKKWSPSIVEEIISNIQNYS